MHRQLIIEQLKNYASGQPDESSTVNRLLDFIHAHTSCFERSFKPGHITGSSWLVNAAGTHVLLTHHRKLNKWLQLGGHADGDPDIRRVALREAQEESGLEQIVLLSDRIFDIDIHLIPERGSEPAHFHYDIRYAMQATGSVEYVISDESHDLDWVEINNLHHFTNERSMLRMAEKWNDIKQD